MDATSGARRVVECRMCGHDDWQEVVSLGLQPLANGLLDPADDQDDEPRYPLDVISCRHCRLMSLTYVVDPSTLYRSYLYVTPDSEMITNHMRYVAELCCRQFSLEPGDLVVEVGSNTGTQLVPFQQAGMRILGIDPARNLTMIANRNGIESLPEFFSEDTARQVAALYGPARLILARHVFAHIDDVAGVAAAVRELLADDGVFAIEVPYAIDLLDKGAFDTIYHEHLSYFSVGTLVTFFERHDLRVIDAVRLPVHGGSILVFVGPQDSRWPVRPSVGELLELERRRGIDQDATYYNFAHDVERITSELHGLVQGLVAKGKRIAGYGAAAKGNTILNACGFGPGEIVFCSDTTDLKQGKLLPGTRIPVISPDHARDHEPDYYLLLAWNYTREILEKESSFLEGGGQFIVPIPAPVTVSVGSDPKRWP